MYDEKKILNLQRFLILTGNVSLLIDFNLLFTDRGRFCKALL